MNTRYALLLLATLLCAAQAHSQSLSDLNDEFDDPATLSSWQRLYTTEGWPDLMAALDIGETEPGVLYMEPRVSTWYNDFQASFLYKLVTGDFIVTARVRATGRTTFSPQSTYSLAGLMVRQPRDITPQTWQPDRENWLFIATGAGDPAGSPMIESKNTLNSRSNLRLTPTVAGWIELGIERRGTTFHVAYREPGGDWQEPNGPFDQPNMPNTIQVGLTAYTDWPSVLPYLSNPFEYKINPPTGGQPDLRAYVDYIRFFRAATTAVEPLEHPADLDIDVYPQPFRDRATLSFNLPTPAPVTLHVYDAAGRIVRTLANGSVRHGAQILDWDAADVPAGVYFYRLVVGGRRWMGPLVHVR